MPRKVQVLVQTLTAITLSWETPLDLGGRDDVSYQLCYELAGIIDCTDVNMNTMGTITGMLKSFSQG